MDKPFHGIHEFKLFPDGETLKMRFAYEELMLIEARYGLEMPPLDTITIIYEMAAIGLQKHHPELTMDAVKEMSPPVRPLQQAVITALCYSHFGTATAPTVKDEMEDGNGSKKKGILAQIFSALQLRRDYLLKSFGNSPRS
jgi:hypothetical protein